MNGLPQIMILSLVALCLSASSGSVSAQSPFYPGKTVRIIVGGSAGGGYDTYTRAISRHLGKHVPGIAKASGVTSIENWLATKTNLKFGGVGPGAATDDVAKIVRATVGVPLQLVSGYKGTADIRLAVNSGELQGLVNSWESFKSGWVKEIETGAIIVALQMLPQRHRELANVPAILEYVKDEEERKIVQVGVFDYGAIARPYVFPPNTPKDRVQALRKALADTYKDPEFIADAQKARLDMAPLSGEELEKIVERTYNLDKNLVAKLKEILK